MPKGNLLKMKTKLDEPVEYSLKIDSELIDMNMLIGTKLSIKYLNEINCIACGAETQTSFAQGYCYNCFKTLPQTDDCILRPELCQAHEGISRDMKWSEAHCLQPHYVYLALSSNLKVGVTRASQIPTRWIDQGASSAIKLAETPNRHLAGVIEVALKEIFTDKTSWQKMLKNEVADKDLLEAKKKAADFLPEELKQYVIEDNEILKIEFPVLEFPGKVKSVNFDKANEISGTLNGIKGQYLIFNSGQVFNVRRHNGYKVDFRVL